MPTTHICWTEGREGITRHDHELLFRHEMFEMWTMCPCVGSEGVSQISYMCVGFRKKYVRTKCM